MDALADLRASFRGQGSIGLSPGSLPDRPCFEYAVWRFLHASATAAVGPDLAVLLRQVARWYGGTLVLPPLPREWAHLLPAVGLRQHADGELTAEAFAPDWLADEPIPLGIDTPPHHARPDERTPAEAHLKVLRFEAWQSTAQKEASWRVLTAPPGSTSLVVLPTGTGKSLLFQLLARHSRGLTVVVVPTVALAIDQCRAAGGLLPDLKPAYYAAGDTADSALASVASRETRLLFTSPEACVSGRLRAVLAKKAADGHLDNLVIDEVHIVDTWGAYFRVDFQLLSGVRRSWMEADGRLRTLLLTATLTAAASDDLRTHFAPAEGRPWIELVSQRLRPEMIYYQRPFDGDDRRDEAVMEALHRLPRPAILYVTEKEKARTWHSRLTGQGFRRIGCFHGDTPAGHRRELLDNWRGDKIDLMVATSAFGLGVDKPDVRAIVHACFPEDMNRYYQEVGRGGRDGWSAVCLLMPTKEDYEVACGLGPRYMTQEMLAERWRAMWESPRSTPDSDTVWELDTSAVREGMLGKRTGEENVRWNKRLLLQMHRAGLLELRNIRFNRDNDEDAWRQWVEVKLLDFEPNSSGVGGLVEASRVQDLSEAKRGLQTVRLYLKAEECVGRTLARMYGARTRRVCGGCRRCRLDGDDRGHCEPLEWDDRPEER
ncbi:MAG: protein DpdF, partial [Gemmataceae bacterium]